MTARPIRYQRQVSDRKGKIFYTSITSLSHISKVSGYEAADGWRRRGTDRHKRADLAKCAKRKDFGLGFYLTTVARIP